MMTTRAASLRSKRRRCDEQDNTTASSQATGTFTAAPKALEHGAVAAVVCSPSQHSYFYNLPSELIAQCVAGFCHRKSQAALEGTCRKFRDALRMSATTVWHFPLSGRFLTTSNANNNNKSGTKKKRNSSSNQRLRFVVLSSSEEKDKGCRRLVSYKSKKDRFNEGHLEVWDAALGCLISLPKVRFAAKTKPVKPSISTNGRWVACGNITYGNESNFQDGILLIRLPSPEQHRKPTSQVVAQRVLEDYEVTSIQFLNNNNAENETVLVFSHLGMDGFLCCKVMVESNASDHDFNVHPTITVTQPSTYIEYPIHDAALALGPDNDDPGHPLQLQSISLVGYGRMAVYNSNNGSAGTTRRALEAFVYSSYDGYVVIRDVLRDVVVTRKVPKDTVEVFDMAFSPDGKRLLLSHFQNGLSVLDNCDAENIQDVGEIEILHLSTDSFDHNNNNSKNNVGGSSGSGGRRSRTGGNGGRSQYGYFSFSPDSKRVVALNMVPLKQFPDVIDVENRRLLSSRDWDDDVSWRSFLFGVVAD